MANDPIPAADLPLAEPGVGDYVVGVQLGDSRRFQVGSLPLGPTATAQLDAAVSAAETARDAAQASGNIYADTTAGLAATTAGDYFSVPSAEDDEYLILYRHDAGPTATEIKIYPAAGKVVQIESEVATAQGDIAALQALDAGNRLDSAEETLEDAVPKVDWLRGGQRYRDAIGEFAYTFTDVSGRVAWGIRQNGDTYIARAEMPVHRRDSSRVLWGVQDDSGKVAFGVQRDGSTFVSLLRVPVAGDVRRDAAPYHAAIADEAGAALLGWNESGEADFLPSTELLNRIAVGGTVAPDAGGYYSYNLRGDGTFTFRTVQSPDQLTYDTVSLDDSTTGTQVVSGPGVIEGLLFYGQSNAGHNGAGGTPVTGALYPSHVFGFSASDPETSVSVQHGDTPVDAGTLVDLLPIQDAATEASWSHFVGTLAAFALEWRRRQAGVRSPGTFIRTDWWGGKTIPNFVRDTTPWNNLMTSAAKMPEVCAAYGREAQVRALVWIQGETEGFTGASYADDLNALLDDVLPEIQLQTGQPELPVAIIVQTNTKDDATPGLSTSNVGQLQVARERYGVDTILAGPMYQCPVLTSDLIHATPEGKMILAELIANAYLGGLEFKPLWPTSATLDGDKITLSFDVPGHGLAFDSDWVGEVSNYGFSYTDSTDSADIASVVIVGNTVEITLTAVPTGASPEIRYAYGEDTVVDGWATGRGLLYSPTSIPSYYANLGYAVPPYLRHYCCKFALEVS